MPAILDGEQCLKQRNQQKKEEVIQFASGLWQNAEKNYSTLEKEIKAALNAIHKFELYLIYKKFILELMLLL
jgi:hypothetical protein